MSLISSTIIHHIWGWLALNVMHYIPEEGISGSGGAGMLLNCHRRQAPILIFCTRPRLPVFWAPSSARSSKCKNFPLRDRVHGIAWWLEGESFLVVPVPSLISQAPQLTFTCLPVVPLQLANKRQEADLWLFLILSVEKGTTLLTPKKSHFSQELKKLFDVA